LYADFVCFYKNKKAEQVENSTLFSLQLSDQLL